MSVESLVGFDQFIARCTKAWRVPGVAVGIVKGNRCVYTHAFGKRDVAQNLPVTEKTLFEIGSITKSFTATALGMLVDEGKLAWDKPVCEYLPEFLMPDPAMTQHVTLRDLLSHRTGMPRHDYAHFGSTASRGELVARLRHLMPSAPFRTAFQYNNMQYIAAGWILEQLAGISWEEFIRTRLFAPLKMRASTFLTELSDSEDNVAQGYWSHIAPITPAFHSSYLMISAGPAGAISSNIPDMCRWLAWQMHDGKIGTQELLKPATLQALHTPVIMRQPWPDSEVVNPAYGMAWMSLAYRGHLWVGHTGSTSGFCAHCSFLPREKIGVVVLTNGASDLLPYVLAFNAYDRLLGLPPATWHTRMLRVHRKRETERLEKEQQESKEPVQPTPELASYSGEYRHPGYGHLVVRATDEAIEVDFHRITYKLHQQGDSGYEIVSPWKNRFPATLVRDEDGGATIAITFEPAVAAIAFRRIG